MDTEHRNIQRPSESASSWALVAVVAGSIGIACYFGSVVFKPLPWAAGRMLFFSIGPLTVISAVGVYKALEGSADSIPLLLGTVLTAIGGIVVNLMAVIQDMQFTYFGEQIRSAPSEAVESSLERILWGVNVVQAGLDVSWDIFVSLGTLFLAAAAWRHSLFGWIIGSLGVIAAVGALMLNLIAYPTAPSEAGLIDLGPAVGAWFGLLLVRLFQVRHRLASL